MTIWADGDSLQVEIRRLLETRCLREASREGGPRFRLVYVASRPLRVPEGIGFILVEPGRDAADARIEADSAKGDLAVTRDLPLAEVLAAKGIFVLNDRGESFDLDRARERRSIRDEALRLRALGLAPESPRKRNWGSRELRAFADAFDRSLQKALRQADREGPGAENQGELRVEDGIAGAGESSAAGDSRP